MSKNFYIVLGVSRDADLRQIKNAYRRLALRYHPDASQESGERFVEIQEAYDHLADPRLREEHDLSLTPRTQPGDRGETIDAPPRIRRSEDPLVQPGSELEEFLEGRVPGFYTFGRGTSRQKDLYLELVLSPEEAEAGGLVPLDLPVRQACTDCGGTGASGRLTCETCGGRGRVLRRDRLSLYVPPRVKDGAEVRISLRDIGLPSTHLVVLVRVS